MDFTPNSTRYNLPSDAVWFITGCSSGIGQGIAKYVAAHPTYRLVATARKTAALDAIADGPRVLKVALDVTSQSSVDAAVAAAVDRFGRLDVVINNAGYSLWGDTEAATEEQERRQIETLFWGTVRVSKHAVRVMREENPKSGGRQGGIILNVTSMGGFLAVPGGAFYHAGKFAVEGFTEAFAKEVRPEWNINFCIIEPGGVSTNFTGSSMDVCQGHPAYLKDAPARLLEQYMMSSGTASGWSDIGLIAKAIDKLVTSGDRIPIRLPLGSDSYGAIVHEVELVKKDLEDFKELSNSTIPTSK